MKASCESKQTGKEPPSRVKPESVGRGGGKAALRMAATIAPLGMMLFLGACGGGGGGRGGGAAATLSATGTIETVLGSF
jgi:hypothetical protein